MDTIITLTALPFGFIILIIIISCIVPAKKMKVAKDFLSAVLPKIPRIRMHRENDKKQT
jgi:hypothetical protein